MKRVLFTVGVVVLALLVLAACATPTPQVVKETVVVTKEVEKVVTKEVQKVVTKEVEKVVTKEVEKVVTKVVEKPGQRTLVFASRLFSPPREQEFFINEIIKPWEKEHGVSVNFQIIDDKTLLQRAEVQQKTGHVTTDIVVAHNSRMPEWIDNGWVEDLTDVVKQWSDRHFMTAFNKDTTRDGHQYFLPVGADVYLLLANNKALKYLPEGADIDNLTWEQYAQWAVNIAQGEGEGKVCVNGVPHKFWIYQFGGSALSFGGGFPDANSEGAMKAWKIWETIGKANGFIPNVLNVDNCVDPMLRGEAWLVVTHQARVGQVYTSNETQYTVGPAPRGDKGIGTIAGVSGYAVMKGAPNRDLAIQFLEYLTRPEVQVKIAKGTGGFIPPVQEAVKYLGNEPTDEIIRKALIVLDKAIVSGVPAGDYQDWGAVKKCFDDAFADTIVQGKDMTQERADQVQACVDALKK